MIGEPVCAATRAAADAAGVVFDMDGVLVDSGAHHRAAWRAVLSELGVTAPPEFWRVTIGRPAEEAVAPLLVAASRYLAFEDAPAGITAARLAGMRVIGVTTSHTDAELREAGAVATIPDFEGLGWPVALVNGV